MLNIVLGKKLRVPLENPPAGPFCVTHFSGRTQFAKEGLPHSLSHVDFMNLEYISLSFSPKIKLFSLSRPNQACGHNNNQR